MEACKYQARDGHWAIGALVLAAFVLLIAMGCTAMGPAEAPGLGRYRLMRASIVDCTGMPESGTAVGSSQALLEGLSFAMGNPCLPNFKDALIGRFHVPLPADSHI